MKFIKPKKSIKPTPNNRSELVEMIQYGLLQTEARFESAFAEDLLSTKKYILEKNASALQISAGFVFFNSMGLAINSILNGEASSGWRRIQDAYTDMYWAWQIQSHDSVKENIAFDCPTQCEIPQVVVHSLSLKGESTSISRWMASFLLNLIEMGGAAEVEYCDDKFPRFYPFLLKAQLSGSAKPINNPDDYGNYYPLIEAIFSPDKVSDAIFNYCDFRLARAFQFDHMGANKPRAKHDTMYLYEQHWLAIFPFELYAYQVIYQKITGVELSFDVGHPLLSTPFASPPLIELTETALSEDIINFGSNCFGSTWRP